MSSITRRQFMVDGGKIVAGTGALAAILAACGGSPMTSGSSAQNLTLKYWALSYQPNGANITGKLTDAAVAAYKKAHKNIATVDIKGYTGDQAGFTKITQAVQGGTSVDLFRLPADDLPLLVAKGLVSPIDDYLTDADKADIFSNLLEPVTFNGKTYAWPLWVPPVGMYLNLDIFKERGVEIPKDDWTYEQFVEIAQKLTFKRADGTQVYGYTGVIDPGVVNTWPFLMSDGALPISNDRKKYGFDTPEGISGLQKLVDLARKYKVTPPDFGTQSVDDIAAGFSQKKNYAMYSAPSGDSGGYKAANLNFDVKPMPIGKLGKHLTTGGIGLVAVAKLKDQDKIKAAMDMAKYLTGTDVSKDVPGYYLAPGARKSVTVSDPINKFTPFVAYTYLMPLISQWPQIRSLIHTQIQNAVLGKASAEEAFKAPATEINSILAGNE